MSPNSQNLPKRPVSLKENETHIGKYNFADFQTEFITYGETF
jgi:hypothetical protein